MSSCVVRKAEKGTDLGPSAAAPTVVPSHGNGRRLLRQKYSVCRRKRAVRSETKHVCVCIFSEKYKTRRAWGFIRPSNTISHATHASYTAKFIRWMYGASHTSYGAPFDLQPSQGAFTKLCYRFLVHSCNYFLFRRTRLVTQRYSSIYGFLFRKKSGLDQRRGDGHGLLVPMFARGVVWIQRFCLRIHQ